MIVPRSNLRNLMLHKDVVEAVREDKFHIWPFSTIEEGILLLTGKEAGELQEDGSYPEGTFNHAVNARLAEFAKIVEKMPEKEEEEKKETENLSDERTNSDS